MFVLARSDGYDHGTIGRTRGACLGEACGAPGRACGTSPHTHQAKPFVTDLLPAVKVDRCWDAFSVDSSDTPLQGSA